MINIPSEQHSPDKLPPNVNVKSETTEYISKTTLLLVRKRSKWIHVYYAILFVLQVGGGALFGYAINNPQGILLAISGICILSMAKVLEKILDKY